MAPSTDDQSLDTQSLEAGSLDAEAHGLTAVDHHDLDGRGDGMQVLREGDAVYVGHFGLSGAGTSILDVSDPADCGWSPVDVPGGSHTHKVQVADGLLLVNHEQFRGGEPYSAGMAVYDLADPLAPEADRLVGLGWPRRAPHRLDRRATTPMSPRPRRGSTTRSGS